MKKPVATICLLFAIFMSFGIFSPFVSAQGESGAVEIYDRAGLEAIEQNPSGSYILCADIDLATQPWIPFEFSGTFDGNGHTIYNLTTSTPSEQRRTTVDGNHKEYETVFVGLFSSIENASISNLSLKGVAIDVTIQHNCFAAAIAGYSENSRLSNCSAQGIITLNCGEKMCGVAGLVGFGSCEFEDCSVDMILSVTDMVDGQDCEEFLGGILACGYGNITRCSVELKAYASVYGYVHNGAVVGMHHVHTKENIYCVMKSCTISAEISFFEKVDSRRAYCSSKIGENLHRDCLTDGNKVIFYRQHESSDYSTPLLPESCEQPDITVTVVEPTEEDWGYTVYSCSGCGFSLVSKYTKPVVPLEKIELSSTELELLCDETRQLSAKLYPEDATDTTILFSSLDSSVATVDEDGTVTAVAPGATVIVCVSADGTVQAQCAVTVRYSTSQWIRHYILFGWLFED